MYVDRNMRAPALFANCLRTGIYKEEACAVSVTSVLCARLILIDQLLCASASFFKIKYIYFWFFEPENIFLGNENK